MSFYILSGDCTDIRLLRHTIQSAYRSDDISLRQGIHFSGNIMRARGSYRSSKLKKGPNRSTLRKTCLPNLELACEQGCVSMRDIPL